MLSNFYAIQLLDKNYQRDRMNLNKSPEMDDNHDILCAFDVIRPMLDLHLSTHFRSI